MGFLYLWAILHGQLHWRLLEGRRGDAKTLTLWQIFLHIFFEVVLLGYFNVGHLKLAFHLQKSYSIVHQIELDAWAVCHDSSLFHAFSGIETGRSPVRKTCTTHTADVWPGLLAGALTPWLVAGCIPLPWPKVPDIGRRLHFLIAACRAKEESSVMDVMGNNRDYSMSQCPSKI